MSAAEKAEVLVTVASSPTPKRKVLRELGVARSTYYRWLRRREQRGLENDRRKGGPQARSLYGRTEIVEFGGLPDRTIVSLAVTWFNAFSL